MTKITRRKQIYEGKAKIIYEGPEPGTVILHFKDDATAFNNQKKGIIAGKGVINNRITEYLYTKIADKILPTHFIKRLNMREQLVRKLEMIPIEVVVRSVVAGSLAKRYNLEEGIVIQQDIVEFYLKNDELGDPMVTDDHIVFMGLATYSELEEMRFKAYRISDFLTGVFYTAGIRLVDFKLEFGRYVDEAGMIHLMLGDEICPDTCRLWDIKTNEKLDKDRFRRDLGGVEEAYIEVAKRLGLYVDINEQEEN